MRGNIVVAAVVFSLGIVLASVIFVVGIGWSLNKAAARLGDSVQFAGGRIGSAGRDGLADLSAQVQKHSIAVAQAGETIAHPRIEVVKPLPIEQPVSIQGIERDGSLPVHAKLLK